MPRALDLRLQLLGVEPPAWCRVRVPGDLTLADLHRVIQVVMQWDDVHPHVFDVGGSEYGPEPDEEEIALHWAGEDTGITIAKAAEKGEGRFDYTYDFVNERRVGIQVEEEPPGPARIECLDGEGVNFEAAAANARLAEEFRPGLTSAAPAATPQERLLADLTLLLLFLGSWDEAKGTRVADKTMRLEILDALSDAGLVVTNRHRKSVVLTKEGVRRAEALLQRMMPLRS